MPEKSVYYFCLQYCGCNAWHIRAPGAVGRRNLSFLFGDECFCLFSYGDEAAAAADTMKNRTVMNQ